MIVPVYLGDHSYNITIENGAFQRAGEIIKVLAPSRIVIISDETVAQHYLMELISNLMAAGLQLLTPIIVPDGEASKSYAQLGKVLDELLVQHIDRQTLVIALGGGVVGDLAGFAASIALRGIPFVQIPTTLLAQVDSSVGGKTGINMPHGKNLVGSFYQPATVIIDPDLLQTLSHREMQAGYAEVIKYGLINDADFFTWCEANGEHVLAHDPEALIYAIAHSCRTKAVIVGADQREQTGQRALLNLGHTFAHAYEAAAGYTGSLLHGEAVALGLVKAFELSARLNLCSGEASRIAAHLGAVGIATAPRYYGDFNPQQILKAMYQDKKNTYSQLTFILARGIGQAFVAPDIAPADVLAVL